MGKDVRRLYTQFQPETYDIKLTIDKDALTFSGSVTINGRKAGRPSERITLHQKNLKISEATIIKHDKKSDTKVNVTRINSQRSFDEVRLHTDELLYPGLYTIKLEFTGTITRQMNGIYPCYFTHDGKKKKLIATQFESHHAREAFPCIDEPEAKAVFQLSITSNTKENVVSNTPVESTQQSADGFQTVFKKTPKMSTYLLAFVLGEIESKEAKTKDGVQVRVFATPDNVAFTGFALDCAVRTLEFYNEYFDIPYPLAKCDFVALPDFASGAMENWGCITFREQALLVDPKNTSLHLKQFVANVVAHELTHQWFGNLVTMRWWTDLWLNESFASWMSYLAVDKLFPEWKVWTQFIVEEQGYALKQDSLEHTHPIEVVVRHPDEIRTIFDAISYEKGASILLMLQHYLGDEAYRDGLRQYLKTHMYGNTDTVDLWQALEEVSEQSIKNFMGQWTSISGYPIVTAERTSSSFALTQHRFNLNPKAATTPAVWPIPLLCSDSITDTIFDKEQSIVKVSAQNGDQVPVIFNHNRTGFYRVTYDPAYLKTLAAAIRESKISELDRLGILGDSFEASKAGRSSTIDSLKLLEAFANEDSAVVWDIIVSNIGSIRNVMDDATIRKGLKPFVRALSQRQFDRLGWTEKDSDSHFDKLLRPTILGLASYGDNEQIVADSLKMFNEMKRPEDINPDIRGVVYGTASRKGGVAEFEKMLAMHNESKNSEERVTLASAMTNFKQDNLIQRALSEITSDDVRLQDTGYWIAYSFMNRHARDTTWVWLQHNWDWLQTNMGNDLSFYRIPNYAARAYSDESFLNEFTDFFSSKMSPAFERPVNQAIETIQWQSAWKARDLEPLKAYFSKTSK